MSAKDVNKNLKILKNRFLFALKRANNQNMVAICEDGIYIWKHFEGPDPKNWAAKGAEKNFFLFPQVRPICEKTNLYI